MFKLIIVLFNLSYLCLVKSSDIYKCSKASTSGKISLKYRSFNTEYEEKALKGFSDTIFDPVTGRKVIVDWKAGGFLRENGAVRDDSRNFCRIRTLAAAIIHEYSSIKVSLSLKDLFQNHYNLTIWNTESTGPITNLLEENGDDSFISSEYFGPQYESGDIIQSTRNEDVQNTSFLNNYFDLIISTEVFEHVPRPYVGFSEIYRILKPGGKHIFTVPFSVNDYQDNKLAEIFNNKLRFFKKPVFHGDPVRKEGIPVFTIFGLEMVDKLCQIGFSVAVKVIYAPEWGIIGKESIYFVATKN
jgi:hypothetical protein